MKKIIKIAMSAILVLVVSSCANHSVEKKDERVVVKPLPKKCGKFDIVYGSADKLIIFNIPNKERPYDSFAFAFKDEKGEFIGKEKILQRYASKTLLYGVDTWHQTIGGLLREDGKDAPIYTNTSISVQLIQVVENGNINMDNMMRVCRKLKETR